MTTRTPQPVSEMPEVTRYRNRLIRTLARTINRNHDRLVTGSIDAGTYVAESQRLWKLAEAHRVSFETYCHLAQ